MRSLYEIKPAFQGLLRPLVGWLAGLGMTANQVTVGAAVLSVGAGLAVAAMPQERAVFLVLPLVLFVRMALNAIDGMLAREHGQKSMLGMYLNEICDVVSDLALILPFATIEGFPAWAVLGLAFGAVLVEFAGVLGVPAGIGRNYAGPLGKSDRALALGAVAVLIALGLWTPEVVTVIFALLMLLSLVTVANRVRAGLAPSGG